MDSAKHDKGKFLKRITKFYVRPKLLKIFAQLLHPDWNSIPELTS